MIAWFTSPEFSERGSLRSFKYGDGSRPKIELARSVRDSCVRGAQGCEKYSKKLRVSKICIETTKSARNLVLFACLTSKIRL